MANLKSFSHIFEVAFVWELTNETVVLPLGCLQGGMLRTSRDARALGRVLLTSSEPMPSSVAPLPRAMATAHTAAIAPARRKAATTCTPNETASSVGRAGLYSDQGWA